jgi:ABC-2 type transport system ATP-binding protein
METAALEVRDLTKSYGAIKAVERLSFAVAPGTVTGFLGPNGAGKTTTMRMLLGLATPTGGTATVLGVPYRRLPDPVRRVGALLELTGFHPSRSGRDHLRVLTRAAALQPERVDAVLAQVAMTEAADRKVGGYSSGMRQRLGLAAALLGDPEILMLDEPGNGLDPAGVAWLREFLRSFAAAGRTVFVSSHVLAEVAQTADHVVVIDHGRLVAVGSVEELTASAGERIRVRTPDAARLRGALERAGAVVGESDGALDVAGLTSEQVGEISLAESVVLHELRRLTPTLEEAFLALTAEGPAEPGPQDLPPPPEVSA